MTDPNTQSQLDQLAAQVRDLRAEIAPAIAEGLRVYADRPVGEKGAPSLQFGVVDGVFDDLGYASVVLDGDTAGVPINMLGGLVEGERVAVLMVPPSGNVAIGMVTPSVAPQVTPGVPFPALVDTFADTTGVSVAASTLTYLPWVANTSPSVPVNAGLLTQFLIAGTLPAAKVVADGYFTFDLSVAALGIVNGTVLVENVLLRPATSQTLALLGASFRSVTGDAINVGTAWSMSYPCLAGDVIFVRITPGAGSTTRNYSLIGSVKSIT